MKETLRRIVIALLAVAGFLGFILSVIWAIHTQFGKDTGVYIDSKVSSRRIVDSTYDIATYVWYNPNWITDPNGDIEWSVYAIKVKCYDVARVKAEQYQQALIQKKKIKDYLKSVNNTICEP
jgi:hypothetical protein